MAAYHVNKNAQPTGEHEVHENGCSYQPDAGNRQALGDHTSCQSAVKKAKEYYTKVDGCYFCSKACHTR
jgi:hypothetical protein